MEKNDTINTKRFKGITAKAAAEPANTDGEVMKEEQFLVKRAKRGDVDAFAELYEQIYEKLYRFALYTLKNTQDAEDVVSDTVADAFAAIRKLKKEEAFSAWIYRILANKCNRKLREYYIRRQEVSEGITENSEKGDPPAAIPCAAEITEAEWGNSREEHMDVRKTFFELSDEERMIVGMHLFLGYTTKEVSVFMQMNENTVRSKESRAIRKMGSKLKGLR